MAIHLLLPVASTRMARGWCSLRRLVLLLLLLLLLLWLPSTMTLLSSSSSSSSPATRRLVTNPFCSPSLSSTLLYRTTRMVPSRRLFMISQKDKLREQEERQRLAILEEKEIEKEQKILVGKLQELLLLQVGAAAAPNNENSKKTKKKKTKKKMSNKKKQHGAAQKLLKNAAHDGLVDIGWEARKLALQIFYEANRPSDVAMVISAIPSSLSVSYKKKKKEEEENDVKMMNKFGLWAHSMLENWDAAAKHAIDLFVVDFEQDKNDGPKSVQEKQKEEEIKENNDNNPFLSSPDEQDQLRKWAIQALTKASSTGVVGGHENLLEVARTLWNVEDDGPDITNYFLKAYLRERQFKDPLDSFLRAVEPKNCDHESACILLKCGAQDANLHLMCAAWNQLVYIEPSDHLLLLQTVLVVAQQQQQQQQESHPLSEFDQEMIVMTMGAILNGENNGDDKTAINVVWEPGFLSQVFLAVETPSMLNSLFEVCNTYSGLQYVEQSLLHPANKKKSNNNNVFSWIMALRSPAKARILPLLHNELSAPTSDPQSIDELAESAWKIVTSLINIKNPQKSRTFLKGQSKEFATAALFFCNIHHRNSLENEAVKYAQVIMEECWETMLTTTRPIDSTTALQLLNWLPCVFGTKQFDRSSVLAKVCAVMSDQIEKEVAGIVKPFQPYQVEKVESQTLRSDDTKASTQQQVASFSDSKVRAIVDNHSRLLAAFVSSVAAEHTPLNSTVLMPLSSSHNNYNNNDSLKVEEEEASARNLSAYLAAKASIASMTMIGFSQKVLTLDTYYEQRFLGKSTENNNEARDAIRTVMADLLRSNLLDSDEQLVVPAIEYYRSLSEISSLLSDEDYDAIIFPFPTEATVVDPFDTFRRCVLGTKRKKDNSNLIDTFLSKIVEDFQDTNDFAELLPSIAAMEAECDQRQGSMSYATFLDIYSRFLIDRSNLFINLNHVKSFCLSLRIASVTSRSGSVNIPILGRVDLELSTDLWFQRIWSNELAQAVIRKQLGTRMVAVAWAENRPADADIMEDIRFGMSYLLNMYAVAGFFSDEKYIVPGLAPPGVDAKNTYLYACSTNCGYLLEHFAGRYTTQGVNKSEPRSSRRGKSSARGQYLMFWADMVVTIFDFVNRALSNPVYGDDDGEFSIMEDGRSAFGILVVDLLTQVWVQVPPGDPKMQIELLTTVMDKIDWHPSVDNAAKTWIVKLKKKLD